jgi:hypothetical protein
MTESLKERITRVARIAQRTARNHEDQQEAQALIDEMAGADAVEPSDEAKAEIARLEGELRSVIQTNHHNTRTADAEITSLRNEVERLTKSGSEAAPSAAPVDVATADTAPATKSVDKQKGAKK